MKIATARIPFARFATTRWTTTAMGSRIARIPIVRRILHVPVRTPMPTVMPTALVAARIAMTLTQRSIPEPRTFATTLSMKIATARTPYARFATTRWTTTAMGSPIARIPIA